ncbi:lipopolysaccharide biosynthesis protein [Listeria fleischmannii]|uniref:lipopolysaccharide biosynthesis protein n=1 Tax=Listeria fleischmannii TaxID=1069827 RepID=UPI001628FB6F|nr:oligosaccharide flippase family protein [Listeria fleischmannii]MBC1417881.1 oligosaccharide flippase family protein [Listeria fleischmannii]
MENGKSMKKLGKNVFIIALGNIGSKFLVFLLVPFYTYYLTPKEYGLADLIVMSVMVLLPILTLSIGDGLFRFNLDNQNRHKTFSSAIGVWLSAMLLVLAGFVLISVIFGISVLAILVVLLIAFQSLYIILQQQIRSMNYLKLYATSGLTLTLVLLFSNVVCLKYFDLGVNGFLFSQVLAFFVGTLLILAFGRVVRLFSFREMSGKLLKKMLHYSIPLIPNSLLWWLLQVADRYIITFFLGVGTAGLYTAAAKIPSILSLIHNVFFQAWSLTALEEKKEDQNSFFAQVFSVYSLLFFVATAILLCIIQPLVTLLFAPAYHSVWVFIPFLLLGVCFSSFSSFIEVSYMIAKKTRQLLLTSFIGSVLTMLITIGLVPVFGVLAASIATFVGFFVTWLVRAIQMKQLRYMQNKGRFFSTVILLLLECIYMSFSSNVNFLIVISMSVLALLLQAQTVKESVKVVRIMLKQRKAKKA